MNFSWKRDWKTIQWGRTIWLLVLRATVAGLIWGIILMANGNTDPGLGMVVVMPLVYLPAAIILMLMSKILAAILGDLAAMPFRWMSAIFCLALLVADPILWALHVWQSKRTEAYTAKSLEPLSAGATPSRPPLQFIPVETYGFLNFTILILVTTPNQLNNNQNV